ncbi:cytochrome c oxidase assembly protein [Microbacterium lacticum]
MRTSPIDVLLSTWRADPVTLVVLVVAAMLCALGIRRAATRGVAWSHRRTATFYALGLGSYALVELGFLGTWSAQLRRAFTARIALLLLAIPGLIALGKPLELARAGLGNAGRARLDALVSGRTARQITTSIRNGSARQAHSPVASATRASARSRSWRVPLRTPNLTQPPMYVYFVPQA